MIATFSYYGHTVEAKIPYNAALLAELKATIPSEERRSMVTMERSGPILTEDECSALVVSLLTARERSGDEGATEAEMGQVIRWARRARIGATALDLVLTGRLLVDVRGDGKVVFSEAEPEVAS